jgi:hypothetical protein
MEPPPSSRGLYLALPLGEAAGQDNTDSISVDIAIPLMRCAVTRSTLARHSLQSQHGRELDIQHRTKACSLRTTSGVLAWSPGGASCPDG